MALDANRHYRLSCYSIHRSMNLAFVHRVNADNLVDNFFRPGIGQATVIDNPITNGDPDVILIITGRLGSAADFQNEVKVTYDLALNKWLIVTDGKFKVDVSAYNVWVIKQ